MWNPARPSVVRGAHRRVGVLACVVVVLDAAQQRAAPTGSLSQSSITQPSTVWR